ncbi:MAG: hypothetical protein JNN18_06955 [Rubrivivax sp.]|nr:hypothetical protein [Rubrivivax sp.]
MQALLTLATALTLAASGAMAQRPQLSAEQAFQYTRAAVLGDWQPPLVPPAVEPELRVDPPRADGRSVFATIQAAVRRAAELARERDARVVIGVAPGRYDEIVFVPATRAPITLQGLGAAPADVRLHAAAWSRMSGAEFARRWALPPGSPYADCAARPAIGTDCTPVLWVRNAGFELRNVTVENRYDESAEGNLHQAVALATEADRVALDRVRLIGNQDTLYLRIPEGAARARVWVRDSLVEGDVDFIFGAATAFFERSEIRSVGGTRGHGATAGSGYITAASTPYHQPHGFVFDDCDFTSDGLGLAGQGRIHLGRQWFAGARCSPYGDAALRCGLDAPPNDTTLVRLERRVLEAVGKVAILRSRLGPHIQRDAPWAPWNVNRAGPAYRLAQYTSDDYWQQLTAAGHDPAAMSYRRAVPPLIFLAEHCNRGPGAVPPAPGCGP